MTLHQPLRPATFAHRLMQIAIAEKMHAWLYAHVANDDEWHARVDHIERRLAGLRVALCAQVKATTGVSYAELTKAMEG